MPRGTINGANVCFRNVKYNIFGLEMPTKGPSKMHRSGEGDARIGGDAPIGVGLGSGYQDWQKPSYLLSAPNGPRAKNYSRVETVGLEARV